MSETRKHLSDCVWAGQPLSAAMSCHCTATPPTPDRAAVRAAVAHADLMAWHAEALARETENPAMRETYARNASSLRTLLAHFTREAR